jgi:hypothetical protein
VSRNQIKQVIVHLGCYGKHAHNKCKIGEGENPSGKAKSTPK